MVTSNTAHCERFIDSPKMTDPEFLKKFDEIVSAKGGINTIGYYFTASTLDDLDIVSTLALEYGDNAAKIKDALRSRTFEGYLGTIHFGQDNFVQNVPVGIYIVKNGKAVYQQ